MQIGLEEKYRLRKKEIAKKTGGNFVYNNNFAIIGDGTPDGVAVVIVEGETPIIKNRLWNEYKKKRPGKLKQSEKMMLDGVELHFDHLFCPQEKKRHYAIFWEWQTNRYFLMMQKDVTAPEAIKYLDGINTVLNKNKKEINSRELLLPADSKKALGGLVIGDIRVITLDVMGNMRKDLRNIVG
jgi:hypothetical protein